MLVIYSGAQMLTAAMEILVLIAHTQTHTHTQHTGTYIPTSCKQPPKMCRLRGGLCRSWKLPRGYPDTSTFTKKEN